MVQVYKKIIYISVNVYGEEASELWQVLRNWFANC